MKWWLLWLALTKGADATTTCIALDHHAQEANPLFSTCGRMIGVNTALLAAQAIAIHRLHSDGHHRLEGWTALGIGGMDLALAYRNHGVIVQMTREGF